MLGKVGEGGSNDRGSADDRIKCMMVEGNTTLNTTLNTTPNTIRKSTLNHIKFRT